MENKWQLIKHETDKDFVYEITNGPISLCVNEDDMPGEDYGEDIPLLNQVVDALNKSGIPFHSENKLELDQHITIMEQSCEIDELQAKCDRYEKALKLAECELTSLYRKLGYSGSNILKEVTEALSAGEGEKEADNG